MTYELPVLYSKTSAYHRRNVREQYIAEQDGLCYWCKEPLTGKPPKSITSKKIEWRYFPPYFLKNPIHLQHDHTTDLTEGAVHALCNAVMWIYAGR